MNLRRSKDKLDVRRRFFQRLQKSVERPDGKHMNLVDDIYSVFTACRSKSGFITDVSDVVNAVITCGVDFHNVKDRPRLNPLTNFTFTAGIAVDRIQTVDRFGKNLGAGGFSCTSRTGEKIGVRKLTGFDLVFERRGNMRLTDNVRKDLRPVFTI